MVPTQRGFEIEKLIQVYNRGSKISKIVSVSHAGISQMKKLQKRIKIKKNMFKKYHELLNNIKGIEFVETDLRKITPWMMDIILESKKK